MNGVGLTAGFLLLAAAAGRGAAHLEVRTSAFRPGGAIPRKFTCDGEDVSPEISWSAAPEGARELALICDDPDAPGGTFTHWVIWGIPKSVSSLPEGIPAGDGVRSLGSARQGTNGFRVRGWRGPCPPPGKPHHYHFRVYALSDRIELPAGSAVERVREAMAGRIVAQGEVVGVYGR